MYYTFRNDFFENMKIIPQFLQHNFQFQNELFGRVLFLLLLFLLLT